MRSLLLSIALMACGGPAQAPEATLPPGIEARDPDVRAALRAARDAKGPDYEPRTRHRHPDGSPVYTNRLILASSPYLLQHAHNPVDWRPWGDEAFELARELDKPVLLSVGYSTCHWCHVMEEESFEDPEIAAFINEHFVPIKVDREERPDVDAVYMRALIALTGRGGWPMTVVLDPQRRPFFAGTYFPAHSGDRGSRTGLAEVLETLRDRWQNDRDNLDTHAEDVSRRMSALAQPPEPTEVPGDEVFSRAIEMFSASFDATHGGFGKAPKFPRPTELSFLFAEHARTGAEEPRDMALATLRAIASGGIRDQVGGGFHRYAVDAAWTVPHFEKMTYDQAQLVDASLDAYQITGDPQWAEIARDTVDFALREMRNGQGAFVSATDADSEAPDGERQEGRFFTWTPDELRAVLGERADLAIAWYGVTDAGAVDGRSVLTARTSRAAFAGARGMSQEALSDELSEIRKALYHARKKRPAPLRDDKVVLGWNAMMAGSVARAGRVLDERLYVEAARSAATFANRNLTDERGRFARTWHAGEASHDAVLVDYALHTNALLDLFEATGESEWLFLATQMAGQMNERFGDPEGGWWETAHDTERLLTRGKPYDDGDLPSGNSAALMAMVRLHALTGDDAWREAADRGFALFGSQLARRGPSMPHLLEALAFRTSEPRQIVLVPGEGIDALREVVRTTHVPFAVRVLPPTEGLKVRIDLAKDKEAIDGRATAYVCTQGVCEKPTTDPAAFRAQLTRRTE